MTTTSTTKAVRAEAAARYRALIYAMAPTLPWHVDIWVPGKPVTKGSTTAYAIKAPNTKRGMRAVTTAANDPDQRAWGAHVRTEVVAGWNAVSAFGAPTSSPVVVWCEFVMPRRASAAKGWTGPHTRKPDTDKLLRMIGDQLTHVIVTDYATWVAIGGV